MSDLGGMDKKKPDITYPCAWGYKVIGLDEDTVRSAVCACLPDATYTLAVSRASTSGKYISLNLTLTVADEAHRNAVFAALAGHADIKMVI